MNATGDDETADPGWESVTPRARYKGIEMHTQRLRVEGGWLYRTLMMPLLTASVVGGPAAVSMVFVPVAPAWESP